jgi:hypothetical protein
MLNGDKFSVQVGDEAIAITTRRTQNIFMFSEFHHPSKHIQSS